MTVPKIIFELVERFDRNREAYRSAQYNETQLRREFIDPFFKALGWDIDNEKGYAEAYKDVIHEDAIKGGGATKAPDYCFRVGGARKFFLEAKKPAVNLMEDINPAYQLRRYAWSTKLPLSILTDLQRRGLPSEPPTSFQEPNEGNRLWHDSLRTLSRPLSSYLRMSGFSWWRSSSLAWNQELIRMWMRLGLLKLSGARARSKRAQSVPSPGSR